MLYELHMSQANTKEIPLQSHFYEFRTFTCICVALKLY